MESLITPRTFKFLRELAQSNNREWFTENKQRYLDDVRDPLLQFVAEFAPRLAKISRNMVADPSPVGGSLFRIYRDTRFSPDKRPYKTAMSAVIGRGGRKATGRSYYVHIQPENQSFVAGGLHSPSTAQLDAVRRAIAEDAAPLRAILAAPAFVAAFGELHGDSLKSAPQGYAKDHPAIDLLRRKQFLASAALSDADVLASDLVARVAADCAAMQPFVAYLCDVSGG